MMSQISSMTEKEKRFIHTSAHSLSNEASLAPKILALSGILQTTLEINELLALLAKELGQFVPFDGMTYRFPSLNIDIKLGLLDNNSHGCSYQLLVAEQQLGELKLYRSQKFEDDELVTIENLLSALLYPLRNTLLYQQALNSASIDPLTGVQNRMSMENTLKREIGLAKRHNSPLSAILLDIDHFKLVNDNHGHLHGDQVLTAVAQCAKQVIRDSDIIFRYGGEEFLILLTNTHIEGASLLAERIRTTVDKLKAHPRRDISVTVSLGVTSLQPKETEEAFIGRADEALYQAKQEGRNRVINL